MMRIRMRGLDGLARRLAAVSLPEAEVAAAGAAAQNLRDALATGLETPVAIGGPPQRPVVSITASQAVARLTGSSVMEADPAVARAAFALRGRRR